ncbi:hypothetical protein J5N97_018212 [Dioscorea zingiberensis]|uniref:ACB domain-containing protein n=1 Tax=Dioscorea zingiberensis TaxID=325984 RepID=A0A9D5HHF0_9LILI|nr:hypothetical protein J5N97_018212 [Dioscorea zingiberensis]
MARPSSGLAYPERFYAAATYAGFGGSTASSSSSSALVSRFQDDVALLLYGLYQQATVGRCNVPKPRAWNPVEHSKWTSSPAGQDVHFGGNHNGRTLEIFRYGTKQTTYIASGKGGGFWCGRNPESSAPSPVVPCAGHSLISWEKKILSVAGHTKDPLEAVTVKVFDPQTCSLSDLKTYGKPPNIWGCVCI